MKHKPTPTPFEIRTKGSEFSCICTKMNTAGDYIEIATAQNEYAEFIVRACNNHEQPVEALKKSLDKFKFFQKYGKQFDCHLIIEDNEQSTQTSGGIKCANTEVQ